MAKGSEPAVNCWEVERQSCGEVYRPYCVVILRNRKAKRSIVQASSSDFESMKRYADRLSDDLYALTDDEFVEKYKLGRTV